MSLGDTNYPRHTRTRVSGDEKKKLGVWVVEGVAKQMETGCGPRLPVELVQRPQTKGKGDQCIRRTRFDKFCLNKIMAISPEV